MRRQRSLVCRAELLDAGVSQDTINTWLRRGVPESVERGVYRSPESPSSDEQRLLAAIFRSGDGARATGWSACGPYGVEGFDLRAEPWVVIPRDRRVRGVDFVVQRADLERCDLATVAGVPAVTPTRALIDVGDRVTDKVSRVGIDDARRKRLVDLERLLARAVQLGRRPGAVAIRRLFGSGQLDQDGELERQLALALQAAGSPTRRRRGSGRGDPRVPGLADRRRARASERVATGAARPPYPAAKGVSLRSR